MATRTATGARVQDGETFTYSAVVRDAAGVAVDLTDAGVTGLISLYRDDTKAAVNSRDAQAAITAGVSVLDGTPAAEGVLTVDAVGNLIMKFDELDSTLGLAVNTTMVIRWDIVFPDALAVERRAIHEATFIVEPLDTVV